LLEDTAGLAAVSDDTMKGSFAVAAALCCSARRGSFWEGSLCAGNKVRCCLTEQSKKPPEATQTITRNWYSFVYAPMQAMPSR
jgi:hypothetical protein